MTEKEMTEEMKEAAEVFCMICAVAEGRRVEEPEPQADWRKIYQIGKRHSVEQLLACAAEQLVSAREEQLIWEKLQKDKFSGIMREAIQYQAYEKIARTFEEEGIDMIPLKGSILKFYYPSPALRFLTDLDLLVKEADLSRAGELLLRLGYTFLHGGVHHDVYQKEPCITIELHKDCGTGYPALDRHLEGVWERSRKSLEREHLYQMAWEDFYLYQTAHLAKHFEHGGVGMRMLLDFLVFENRLSKACSRETIETHLEEAGLLAFERRIVHLAKKGGQKEKLVSDPLWCYIIESGSYGIRKFNLYSEMEKQKSKRSYYLSRLFPRRKEMECQYPWLAAHPAFLWAAWMLRIVQRGWRNPAGIWQEIQAFQNVKERQMLMEIMREAGLEERNENL